MSGTTVFGVVLIAFCVAGIAAVAAMFMWGAREDGRDQQRTNERLTRDPRRGPRDTR
jgi:hypothetical protein